MMEFARLVTAQALLLGGQCVIYFGSEKFQKNPHNVYRAIDRRIPFVPAWVFAYVLWFPLIALFPLAAYYADTAVYERYISAILADNVGSVLIYLIYPTTFARPEPPHTWTGWCLKLVYRGSYRGLNCAPSLHCSQCYLVILSCFICPALPLFVRMLSCVVAVLIVISTVCTKQHALIDVLTAVPMAALCWLIGSLFPAAGIAAWVAGG